MAECKGHSGHFNDPEFYCITRIKAYPQHKLPGGWQVFFSRRGKLYRKSFKDDMCGSSEASLAAAKAWRDELLPSLAPTNLRERWSVLRLDNTSGMAGVHKLDLKYRVKGQEKRKLVWVAEIKQNGKRIRKYFSILKYGEEGARQRAEEARQHLLEQVEGVLLYSPAAKAMLQV